MRISSVKWATGIGITRVTPTVYDGFWQAGRFYFASLRADSDIQSNGLSEFPHELCTLHLDGVYANWAGALIRELL